MSAIILPPPLVAVLSHPSITLKEVGLRFTPRSFQQSLSLSQDQNFFPQLSHIVPPRLQAVLYTSPHQLPLLTGSSSAMLRLILARSLMTGMALIST